MHGVTYELEDGGVPATIILRIQIPVEPGTTVKELAEELSLKVKADLELKYNTVGVYTDTMNGWDYPMKEE